MATDNDNKENENIINSKHLNQPENDTNIEDENNNNNSNDNDLDCFKCPRCAFKNNHDGVLCQMCNEPLLKLNQLPQNTWNQILELNHCKLPTVPQWIKCIKCNKWRTIPVPISIIKTWQPRHNWSCDANHELMNGCNTKSKIPNTSTHSSFELLALQTQRHLVCIQENTEPQRHYKELQQKIQHLMKKIKPIIAKQELQRNDTIKSNQSCNCDVCTYHNQHSGNLCAMCDTAKPGSRPNSEQQNENAKMKIKCSEQIKKYKEMKSKLKSEKKFSENVSNEKKKLILTNNKLRKLIDELKEMDKKQKLEIETLQNKNNELIGEKKEMKIRYIELEKKYNEETKKSKYWIWSGKDIANWIINLNQCSYSKYYNDLIINIKNEGINGYCLVDLDKNDLHRLGITQFKDKNDIYNQIQALINNRREHQRNNENEGQLHIDDDTHLF